MELCGVARFYPETFSESTALKYAYLLPALCALGACQQVDRENDENPTPQTQQTVQSQQSSIEFADDEGQPPVLPAALEMMTAQVALERAGFSPGVIDGKMGQSMKIALNGFQVANDLEETGELDEETKAALGRLPAVPTTRLVRIPAAFTSQQFFPDLPEDAADLAKLPALGYRNLMEAIAERFHTTPETLVALNSPDTIIGPNRVIVVPNVADAADPGSDSAERGWDKTLMSLGVASEQVEIEKIVVDKSEGWLRAYGADESLIAQFPVTTGSSHNPLPLGNWTVKGVARNPDYSYDPKLLRGVDKNSEKQIFKPGPNSPVGVVWIDLSKEHYGIHGTSEPATIGRAESNGCVRLTNWNAAKLAGMVKPGVKVLFQA